MTATRHPPQWPVRDCHSGLAFTLVELLAILVIIAVLAGIVLPGFARARHRAGRIQCTSNLKQIGLAFKTWALDAGDRFPMRTGMKTVDPLQGAAPSICRYFQVMSNELASTRILICPADYRVPAPDFGPGFTNTHLSYFLGLDADGASPQMFLSGDRNLTNGTPLPDRILVLSSNTPAFWDHQLHRCQGNIALADGSVQQCSNSRLREGLSGLGGTNRLALP